MPNSDLKKKTSLSTEPKAIKVVSDPQLQTALLEMCHRVMSSLDLEEVLSELLRHAKNILEVELVAFAILEDDATLKFTRLGLDEQIKSRRTSSSSFTDKGLVGLAFQTGKIATSSDYWKDQHFERSSKLDADVKSMGMVASLVAPIYVGGEIVAVLSANKSKPYAWNETDLLRAEEFAALAALAIRNARLYNQLEKLNNALAERNHELETLQTFSQHLREPFEIEAAVERALSLAMEIVKAEGGRIFLLDKENPQKLKAILRLGDFTTPARPERPITPGVGLTGKVAQTGQSILVKDMLELLRENPDALIIPNPSSRSGMFVPVVAEDKIIGVMSLLSPKPDHFSQEQLRFAEMLAGQIGLALEQVSRIKTYKEQEQLEAVLALARTAAHELNQSLTLLQAELDFALQLGVVLDEAALERMQEAVTAMTNKVRRYQKITRVETVEALPGIKVLSDKNVQQGE